MAPHIYLFHGHDNYTATKKLNHWRREFEKKYGDFNIHIFEGENFTAANFNEAVSTVPFLGEKKLIIIRDFLRDASEEEQKLLAEKLENAPESCVTVFIEHEKPDARTTLFKKLSKTGQAIEFEDFEKPELVQWIRNEFTGKNSRIGSREADMLADTVGPDLWQMESEIEKLSLYGQEMPIDEKAIEAITSPNLSSSIFKLTDYIAQRNSKIALRTLNTLLQSREDLFQIFFMIVRHFRILIEIKACLEKKLDRAQIIQKTHEHPYAIKTGTSQCRNFTADKLAGIYRKLLQIDIATKSGRIKTLSGDSSELRLALEKLIVELCA